MGTAGQEEVPISSQTRHEAPEAEDTAAAHHEQPNSKICPPGELQGFLQNFMRCRVPGKTYDEAYHVFLAALASGAARGETGEGVD